METWSATTFFWLIALGATTGWIVSYSIGREGISMTANLSWGIAATVGMGMIGLWLGLSGVLAYSFMGTLATLFLANAFHLHHKEDMGTEQNIRVKRKGAPHR